MITLLRENSVSCRVLAALHLGRTNRAPEGATPKPSPMLEGVYIPAMTFPEVVPGAHPFEAAFPRDVAPAVQQDARSTPPRQGGMVLRPTTGRPSLVQGRPRRHLALVQATEAIVS